MALHGIDSFSIEELENREVENMKEQFKIEQEWIARLEPQLNSQKAFLSYEAQLAYWRSQYPKKINTEEKRNKIKERQKLANKKWCDKNKEKVKEDNRIYRESHKEEIRNKAIENKDKIKKYNRKWVSRNRDKTRSYDRKCYYKKKKEREDSIQIVLD